MQGIEASRRPDRGVGGDFLPVPSPPGRWLAALNVVLWAAVVAGAVYFAAVIVPAERRAALEAWRERLASMADDRRTAVARWVAERVRMASLIASYPTVAHVLESSVEGAEPGPAGPGGASHLAELVGGAAKVYSLRGCLVVGPDGAAAASSPAGRSLTPAIRSLAVEAQRLGAPLVEMVVEEGGRSPIVAAVAPVDPPSESRGGGRGRPVGAVVLLVDPARWLFPFLATEPVRTETGETLLVQREGGRVAVLNRSRRPPALPLEITLPATPVPFMERGASDGAEPAWSYGAGTGAAELGVARTVPGTRWGLLVKVDRREALATVHQRLVREAAAFAGTMAALVAAGLGVLATRRARFRAEVAGSEARFASLFESANDAVMFLDTGGRVVAANRKAEELYGYSHDELLAMTAAELRAPEGREEVDRRLAAMREGGGSIYETVALTKDGRRVPVEASTRREPAGAHGLFLAIVRDVSERKAAEERILGLNRLLGTISEVNQLVVRERTVDRLLEGACRIVVERGGYRMAWIGLAVPETREVRPVTSAGHVDGYLDGVEIRYDDTPAGRGPTGTAIRERRPVVAADWANDRRIEPWRERGLARGYRSSAAVPLLVGDVALGALTVYADRPGVFDGEVVNLLIELTGDLAFALQSLETEREKGSALRALTRSEHRFRLLFEGISSGAVIYEAVADGEDFVIREFNRAAQRIERVALESVVGRRVTEAFPGVVDLGLLEVLRRVWRTGAAESSSAALYRDRRIEGWRENFVFKLPSGELVAVYDDVTARKRAEADLRASEERYRSLFDHMLEGFAYCRMLFDGERPVDFTYVAVNDAFRKLTGLEDVVGRNVSEVIPGLLDSNPEIFGVYGRVSRTGLPERFETLVQPLGIWLSISVYSPKGGEFVAVFDNISERKRVEGEIRDLNRELEDRVRRRTAELEAANDELEAFSYSVSHDLRAPLRAIEGFTRALAEDHGPQMSDEGERLLGVIRTNTQRMTKLIDDLLEFSRAARRELRRVSVDMTAFAREAFEEQVPEGARAGITLRLGELPAVAGDPATLRQVWANLLSNAVKFSRAVERPEIDVSGRREGEEVVFEVRDNGVGFDMRYADRLFGVFQRLHSAHDFEGTGVGLALVQRIVRRHGGRVWATATVDGGATFSFALPAAEQTP